MPVLVRPAQPADAQAMCDVINPIIAEGSTTAHRRPFDPARIQGHYIASPRGMSCVTAWDSESLLGFQSIDFADPNDTGPYALPAGWGDIGSFVAPEAQGRGVGRALFAASLDVARQVGLIAIDATIRADNVPGLAYYSGLGFVDYARIEGLALSDGTIVDRIRKRFTVT